MLRIEVMHQLDGRKEARRELARTGTGGGPFLAS
eukprot:COSAG01_NODE_2089_length_8454_cov_12.054339_15_plen_34_part_00